jgi:hypothetical protein
MVSHTRRHALPTATAVKISKSNATVIISSFCFHGDDKNTGLLRLICWPYISLRSVRRRKIKPSGDVKGFTDYKVFESTSSL